MSDATPAVATGKENKVTRVHFVTVNADAFGVLAARTAVQADIQTFINVRGKAGTVERRRALAAATIGSSQIALGLRYNLFARNLEESLGFAHRHFDVFRRLWRRGVGDCCKYCSEQEDDNFLHFRFSSCCITKVRNIDTARKPTAFCGCERPKSSGKRRGKMLLFTVFKLVLHQFFGLF